MTFVSNIYSILSVKGEQHNFETVAVIFNDLTSRYPLREDWKSYWAKALTFDALIGNTDRHQDNWGIIQDMVTKELYIAPVFDNGTSMGHEISGSKLVSDMDSIERYVSRGRHHMKWSLNDQARMRHIEMLNKLANEYPETREIMVSCIKRVNSEIFMRILERLVAFEVPIRLSTDRANFMLKLLQHRHQRLLNVLET